MSRAPLHGDSDLGIKLKQMRRSQGLRQSEVVARMRARGSTLSITWLSQIENGRRQPSQSLGDALLGELTVADEPRFYRRRSPEPEQPFDQSEALLASIVNGVVQLDADQKRAVLAFVEELLGRRLGL